MMSIMDRPISWHKDMDRNKLSGCRLARTQGMEAHSLFAILLHDILDQALFMRWEGCIHETRNGATHQLNARPNDVKSNDDRDQGIQDTPARESRNGNATDHT